MRRPKRRGVKTPKSIKVDGIILFMFYWYLSAPYEVWSYENWPFSSRISRRNSFSSCVIDLCGGSIVTFHLHANTDCKWRMETMWPDHETCANVLIVDCHTMTDLCLQCHPWHVTRDTWQRHTRTRLNNCAALKYLADSVKLCACRVVMARGTRRFQIFLNGLSALWQLATGQRTNPLEPF